MTFAFLSPYPTRGHVGANQRKGPSPAAPKMKDHPGEQLCLARLHLKGNDKVPDLLWKGEVQEGTLPQHGL